METVFIMKSKAHINLKTKMMILFLAIILVPMMCVVMVFLGYGYSVNIDMIQELSKKDIMIGAMVNRSLLKSMLIAMVIILIMTSAIITAWLNRDIYRPLKELSLAMQHISMGDFDYHMNGGRGDEIGLLFDNYEQMRLQLKESEEEKAQNEKKSKELVSNISHDLKTPITSIKGYVEGIMDGVADTPEKIDKYIKTIYNKANDMDRLINELTTYSGIDSNKIPYHFHILNVTDYFTDCVEEVGLDLESKNIHLDFTNLVPANTCVVADPEQLKKVINNIINNSVKYMGHPNGVIDIRLLDEGESVKIEIEDDGKGIASKDIGNIFERFYRTDSSRNSLQGGSGIGLSIVKKIIEDHGGYVWATSKEGEGTCMHFVLRKYTEKMDEVVI
ncbi:MAG: HAMP domain-containing histidine kinase [Lachnospiraceae bacterium]|nr:HAMP domain-containing histidine kinase [Lachnospiraceae bacterium]